MLVLFQQSLVVRLFLFEILIIFVSEQLLGPEIDLCLEHLSAIFCGIDSTPFLWILQLCTEVFLIFVESALTRQLLLSRLELPQLESDM